ncbi:MAG TPA: hypothetical protein VF062_01930 [Candidatus Limnocylindrales bacterium]
MPEITTTTDQAEHSKPIRLARTALDAAMAGRWDAAQRALQRIGEECGDDGLGSAVLALCDTLIAHATDGDVGAKSARISFMNGDTGQLDQPGSDQVPAEVQWAARLIGARAAMDEDRFVAVLDELPRDGLAIGRHVWSLLQVVAWTVNGLPRGYTRMGRGGSDA